MGADWTDVKVEMKDKINDIKKYIQSYSYSNTNDSAITDEVIFGFMIKELRRAKNILFTILETLYEIHEDQTLINDLQLIRTQVDVFSDQLKKRTYELKYPDKNHLMELVLIDSSLVKNIENLNTNLAEFLDRVLKGTKNPNLINDAFWEAVAKRFARSKNDMERVVTLFRERESILKIDN